MTVHVQLLTDILVPILPVDWNPFETGWRECRACAASLWRTHFANNFKSVDGTKRCSLSTDGLYICPRRGIIGPAWPSTNSPFWLRYTNHKVSKWLDGGGTPDIHAVSRHSQSKSDIRLPGPPPGLEPGLCQTQRLPTRPVLLRDVCVGKIHKTVLQEMSFYRRTAGRV